MKITREDGRTIVESCLNASCSKMTCIIGESGGDNADAKFRLTIQESGQVWRGCDLELCGPSERDDMIEFLEQVVFEMKRIK